MWHTVHDLKSVRNTNTVHNVRDKFPSLCYWQSFFFKYICNFINRQSGNRPFLENTVSLKWLQPTKLYTYQKTVHPVINCEVIVKLLGSVLLFLSLLQCQHLLSGIVTADMQLNYNTLNMSYRYRRRVDYVVYMLYTYLVCLLRGVILTVCGRCSQWMRSRSTRGGLAAGLLILTGGGACEPPVATS